MNSRSQSSLGSGSATGPQGPTQGEKIKFCVHYTALILRGWIVQLGKKGEIGENLDNECG